MSRPLDAPDNTPTNSNDHTVRDRRSRRSCNLGNEYNGDRCCCNCKSLYRIHVCSCPACPKVEGFICIAFPDDEAKTVTYQREGHGLCELHTFDSPKCSHTPEDYFTIESREHAGQYVLCGICKNIIGEYIKPEGKG